MNTTAPFLVTKYVARIMVDEGKGGRTINLGSAVSKRERAGTAVYSTSNFTVIGLTQASALDLAPHRITVNACPGSVNTDRMNYSEVDQARAKGMSLEGFRVKIVADTGKAIPLGPMAEPEDIAQPRGIPLPPTRRCASPPRLTTSTAARCVTRPRTTPSMHSNSARTGQWHKP